MKKYNSFILSCLVIFCSSLFASSDRDANIHFDEAPICGAATPMTCGVAIWAHAAFRDDMTVADYDLSSCFIPSPSVDYSGNDYLYKINVGIVPTTLHITMTNNTTDMDVLVFRSCGVQMTDCVGSGTKRGNVGESVLITNATGVYYIVVDGPHNYNNSGFMLKADCSTYTPPPPPPTYGDDCTSGVQLRCGDVIHSPYGGNNSFDLSNYDISGCTHAGYDYKGYDYLYHIDLGYHPQNITINLTGLHADMDMFLFRTCQDHYGNIQFSGCEGYSIDYGNASEQINLYNASGKYILVVDGYTTGVNSSFNLSLDCHTQPQANCYSAENLYCGESRWVDAPYHNNFDGSDYNLSGCLGYGYDYKGKDHLYKIDAGYSSNKQLVIKMSGLHADLDLLLFKECGTHYGSIELHDCVDYSVNSGHYREEIVVDNAHGVYYLAVDGADPWYNSGYEISVECNTIAQDICHYATPLYCGDSKWVPAATHNHLDNNHYDYNGCFNYNYGFTGNDHLYEINAGSTPQDIVLKVSGLYADLDMLLYRSCGSHYGQYGLSNCVDYSIRSGYSDEEITIHGATGTYYLAIDSNDPWDRSGYEISMYCHYQNNFSCQDALWLGCDDLIWSEAPRTNHLSGSDYLLTGCSGGYVDDFIGYDHLYEINVGYDATHLTIELSNLTDDLDLLVFSSCSSNYSTARLAGCVGLSDHDGTYSEKVDIDHAQGTYYVVVDSKSAWNNSSYKLKTHCTSYYDDPGDDDPSDDQGDDDEPTDDSGDDEPTDDPIENPDILTCGSTYYGSTIDGESNFENEDISSCFQTNLVYTGADELVPFEKINDGDIIDLVLIQDDANLSLFVLDEDMNFIELSCRGYNYSSGKVIENDNVVGEIYSDEGALPAGNYYALVEGYNRTIESDFTLSMSCGNVCTVSDIIACEDAIIGGTNQDSSNNHNTYIDGEGFAFVGFSGGEWISSLTIDSAVEITIDLYNIESEGDLDLFFADSCGSNIILATSQNGVGIDEQIVISIEAGEYFIIVDGWNGASGTFDLEVTGCGDITVAARDEIASTRSISAINTNTIDVQVIPNPFSERASMLIESLEPSQGELQLFSVDGRLLSASQLRLNKGTNQIMLDESAFGDQFGLILYRLNTPANSYNGSILRVR